MLATEQENIKLKTRLEEINIINRAKLLLIQCLSMTEHQAHRYLEKQAMNLRTSKLEISKQVIKTYDNQGFTGNKQ
jgi:response regulator NasT